MRRILTALATAALLLPAAACGASGSGGSRTVTVTIGYQSKTINTVTAGTLLRSLGYFERDLDALGKREGVHYRVSWQDYATGAPITAAMVAGKVDIGSMGDFPLLINASRGRQLNAPTRLISVTGYNLRGALNTIVTAPDSSLTTLRQLRGKKVSTSVGSAADGTLKRALRQVGIDPNKDVTTLNQQPSVGASALDAGSVDALSQFVAWPGLLAFQGKAKALYDGGQLDLPTFHGVAVRQSFAEQRPAVVKAFLAAQIQATDYLNAHPLTAAEQVAKATGLPPEVVYLYNGADGIATFDPALKPQLLSALGKDVSILTAAGLAGPVDVSSFVDDRYLKAVYGSGYAKALASTPGGDPDQVWLKGEDTVHRFATPAALLAYIDAHGGPAKVRAAYVPDATTGTLWFADRSVWVRDKDGTVEPFVTPDTADAWVSAHPGARIIGYPDALRREAS